MNAPDPGEDFTGHTEIELLRVIAERQGQANALLSQQIQALNAIGEVANAGFASMGAALVALGTKLDNIDDTLSTFLSDWLEENTAPSDPAVKVTVVWGEPQPISKGP